LLLIENCLWLYKWERETLRITYLLWGIRLVGGCRIVFEHVNRLIDRGYEVNVVSHFGEDPDWFSLKTKIIKLPPFSSDFPASDVIVTTYWPTIYEAEKLNIPKKFMLIQGYDPVFYTPGSELFEMCKNAFSLKLKPLVVSRWLQERVKKEFNRDSIHVPNGIDLSVFKMDNKNQQKKELNILYVVGDYGHWKGIKDALQVFKIVKKGQGWLKTIGKNKVRIIFVSTQNSLPAGAEGLVDEFYSNPTQAELVKLYNRGDVFLHSSICEGFGLPPLEAMACGNAVVTTDSGGVREFCRHEHNCLLVAPKDPVGLAKAVSRLIENGDLRGRLAKNGIETAKEFNWERSISLLEQAFKEG